MCRLIGWKTNAYKFLIWKPDGLFRPRYRYEGNITIEVIEMRLEVCGLDSLGSDEGLVEGFCVFSRKKIGNVVTQRYFLFSSTSIQFSRKILIHDVI